MTARVLLSEARDLLAAGKRKFAIVHDRTQDSVATWDKAGSTANTANGLWRLLETTLGELDMALQADEQAQRSEQEEER